MAAVVQSGGQFLEIAFHLRDDLNSHDFSKVSRLPIFRERTDETEIPFFRKA